jgi:hypothetical protein
MTRERNAIVIAGAALGCVLLYFRDPALGAPFPACPFHAVTGLDCPVCGTGRALHRLLHGRLHEAFSLNALVFLAVPALVLMLRFSLPRWANWSLLALVAAFTVARNLPWGPLQWMSSYH